jgi:lysophospholipase L1-like esterase
MQQRKTRNTYYSSIRNTHDDYDTDDEESFQDFSQTRTSSGRSHTVTSSTLQQETITFDNLTSNKARNNILFTITNTQGGNTQSKSGFYHPPTFQQTIRKYRFKLVFGFLSTLMLILTIQHGNYRSHHHGGNTNHDPNSTLGTQGGNNNWNDSINDHIPDLIVDVTRPQTIPLCRPSRTEGINSIGGILNKSRTCTCPDPLIPSPGPYANWNGAQKDLVQSIDPSVHYDIVFVGDSITHYWNRRIDNTDSTVTTTTALEQAFPDSKVLALGIPGDTVGSLLYRLQIQELDNIGRDPAKGDGKGGTKIIWVLIGTNDLSFGCSDERIYAGIVNYLEELTKVIGKSGMVGATIVINGILPRTSRKDGVLMTNNDGARRQDMDPNAPELDDDDASSTTGESSSMENDNYIDYWLSIKRINNALKAYASQHEKIEFYDANQVFIGHVGNSFFRQKEELLMKELQYDYLHPTTLGYTLWGKDIQDFIASDLDVPDSLKDFNS